MAITNRPGPVRSGAHQNNLLHPGFPRVKSRTESDLTRLYSAGYHVALSNLVVLIAEPSEDVEALEATFPEAGTTRAAGPRRPRKRKSRLSKDAARRYHAQRPRHYARANVTVTDPQGSSLSFSLEQSSFPARYDRIARNRLVPVDVLDLVVHTLVSWGEDLDDTDQRGVFGKNVCAVLDY